MSIQLSSPSVEPLPSLTHSTAHPSFFFSLYPLTLIFAPSSLLPFPLSFSSLQYRQAEFPGGSGTAHCDRPGGAPNRLVALAEGSTWSARGEPMKGKKGRGRKGTLVPVFWRHFRRAQFLAIWDRGRLPGTSLSSPLLTNFRVCLSPESEPLNACRPCQTIYPSIFPSMWMCVCQCSFSANCNS